ncbi:hypothetical protein EDB86DRAFT_2833897 [Lactarius hatsudake]|nr:hypothetical protein EDB86DRAFT_2833897 [Lactarius hatsudake]
MDSKPGVKIDGEVSKVKGKASGAGKGSGGGESAFGDEASFRDRNSNDNGAKEVSERPKTQTTVRGAGEGGTDKSSETPLVNENGSRGVCGKAGEIKGRDTCGETEDADKEGSWESGEVNAGLGSILGMFPALGESSERVNSREREIRMIKAQLARLVGEVFPDDCVRYATTVVDPAFAKKQLDLLAREWYMLVKPDGQIIQIPAYEWNFSDVNPPVHAWATFLAFKIEHKLYGHEDVPFLERIFQKLLLSFTWWVNRKDAEGANVFKGGFLQVGLDNIGVFNRSEPLPTGGTLRQADGTAWMAFKHLLRYSIGPGPPVIECHRFRLNMALELAKHNPVYEDIASKCDDIPDGEDKYSLWNEHDGMYYDAFQWGGHSMQLPPRNSKHESSWPWRAILTRTRKDRLHPERDSAQGDGDGEGRCDCERTRASGNKGRQGETIVETRRGTGRDERVPAVGPDCLGKHAEVEGKTTMD